MKTTLRAILYVFILGCIIFAGIIWARWLLGLGCNTQQSELVVLRGDNQDSCFERYIILKNGHNLLKAERRNDTLFLDPSELDSLINKSHVVKTGTKMFYQSGISVTSGNLFIDNNNSDADGFSVEVRYNDPEETRQIFRAIRHKDTIRVDPMMGDEMFNKAYNVIIGGIRFERPKILGKAKTVIGDGIKDKVFYFENYDSSARNTIQAQHINKIVIN